MKFWLIFLVGVGFLAGCQSLPQGENDLSYETSSTAVAGNQMSMTVQPIERTHLHNVNLLPKDIWERLRRGFVMPQLDSPLVDQFAIRFAEKNYFQRTEGRARRYLFYFVEEIERRGLPLELALLPFVESAMNPHAQSPVGATGAWQFMRATGRTYDLRISHLVDDRKSLTESTRGAMDYMQKLYRQFGDWHLALAAYNWGETAVARAQAKNRAAGLPTGYLDIRMPAETRSYAPQLEALKRLVQYPERFNISLPELPNEPYFVEVAVPFDMDVEVALRCTGLPETEFFALNPSVKRPLLMAAATPRLWLPKSVAAPFSEQLARERSPVSWSVIKLGKTERIENIAASLRVSPALLRQVNRIPVGMKPAAGSSLLLPVRPAKANQVDEITVAVARLDLTPDRKRIALVALQGENLRMVARRSGLAIADLQGWNPGIKAGRHFPRPVTLVAWVSPDYRLPSPASNERKEHTSRKRGRA